jgi:hypothetical protein
VKRDELKLIVEEYDKSNDLYKYLKELSYINADNYKQLTKIG